MWTWGMHTSMWGAGSVGTSFSHLLAAHAGGHKKAFAQQLLHHLPPEPGARTRDHGDALVPPAHPSAASSRVQSTQHARTGRDSGAAPP